MNRVTGTLTFHCADEGEALMIAAGELAGRWRQLGWNVDDIEIAVIVHEPGDDGTLDDARA